MFQHEVEALKVGDLVAISPAYTSRTTLYVVDAVVTKVNGHGHVTIEKGANKWIVDKRGNEKARSKLSSYYYSVIDNDTGKSRNAAIAAQHEANQKVNALVDAIAACKTYGNDYKISMEVKRKLMELVTAL